MEKYIAIRDISKFPSYANVNARLVYLHVACNVDVSNYNYHHSLRRLSMDLGISLQKVRTAIKMLEADGLIVTHLSTRQITQALTHLSTQQTTHLHIVRISELDTQTDTQTNTPTNTPANTPPNTPPNTQINNINNINTLNPFHTHDAQMRAREWKKLMEKEFSATSAEVDALWDAFFARQALKDKAWESEGDCLAHLISWCEKRLPRDAQQKGVRLTRRMDDTQCRVAERERAALEQSGRSATDRARDELARLTRWRKEWQKEGIDTSALEAQIAELKKQLAS